MKDTTESQQYCECGCGEIVKPNCRFVYAHNLRGDTNPAKRPDVRKKISEGLRKYYSENVHPGKGKTYEEILGEEKAKELKQHFHLMFKGKPQLWSRGENNPAKRPENRKKISEALKGVKLSEEAKKSMSIAQQKRMRDDPEEWHRTCVKGGTSCYEKHPSLFKESLDKYRKEHPNASSEMAKERNRKWKEQDPEDYYKKKKEYARLMIEARMKAKEENPELFKLRCAEASIKGCRTRMKNSPYFWNNVSFLSKEEIKCGKMLLKEPIDGVNCNIRIGRKFIDFFPQSYDKKYQGKFVEYHPWDWSGLTTEEYYNQRKEVIESSKYKGTELIVITNLKEV